MSYGTQHGTADKCRCHPRGTGREHLDVHGHLAAAGRRVAAPHEEYSDYSVRIMFRHLALHDLYHAYRIEERLLRKAWD